MSDAVKRVPVLWLLPFDDIRWLRDDHSCASVAERFDPGGLQSGQVSSQACPDSRLPVNDVCRRLFWREWGVKVVRELAVVFRRLCVGGENGWGRGRGCLSPWQLIRPCCSSFELLLLVVLFLVLFLLSCLLFLLFFFLFLFSPLVFSFVFSPVLLLFFFSFVLFPLYFSPVSYSLMLYPPVFLFSPVLILFSFLLFLLLVIPPIHMLPDLLALGLYKALAAFTGRQHNEI